MKSTPPPDEQEKARREKLHEELVAKHGPGKYWTGSTEELEAKKAEDDRLCREFAEKHKEANARANPTSQSTTFFGRAQDKARKEFAKFEADKFAAERAAERGPERGGT